MTDVTLSNARRQWTAEFDRAHNLDQSDDEVEGPESPEGFSSPKSQFRQKGGIMKGGKWKSKKEKENKLAAMAAQPRNVKKTSKTVGARGLQ